MVKNAIKVYGRIKRTDSKTYNPIYNIKKQQEYEEIVFNTDIVGDYAREFGYYKPNRHRYRFYSVFEQNSTQSDIFDVIAKPVVDNVLEGYNGTIFAYGQTGSGKTYSMTGASEYETRGIIPRTVQYIFQHIQNSPAILYNIYISYMEIYNEIGFDLLNPKHRATYLEDLPRVTTLEDAKGQIHLRNLGVISVASEREAMCLLFLGDTNRTIAETPMNMNSSRSHCIFTVYVAATLTEDGRVRRSKLHLVDLAGSERIQKSSITGNLLVDARQINLSLHYLEQVIIALSDEKRSHIPYRNSMMTSVLRDSLGGNCLTTMIATLSPDPRNFEETISTCKFAQRVALVSSEVFINEDEDPEVKIGKLKLEIENLKKQLVIYKGPFKYGSQERKQLSPEQIKDCEKQVSDYIESTTDEFPIEGDINKILMYFKIFKRMIKSQIETNNSQNLETKKSLAHILNKKDDEIQMLSTLLKEEKQKSRNAERNILVLPRRSYSSQSISNTQSEEKAFDIFMHTEHKSEMNKCAIALKQKIAQAKIIAKRIKMCKDNIVSLKMKVRDNINNNPEVADRVMSQLQNQQDIYRETIITLSNLKSETDHLSHAYEQERLRTLQRFKNWYENENQQYFLENSSSPVFVEKPVSFIRDQETSSCEYLPAHGFPESYAPYLNQHDFSNVLIDTFPALHENEPNLINNSRGSQFEPNFTQHLKYSLADPTSQLDHQYSRGYLQNNQSLAPIKFSEPQRHEPIPHFNQISLESSHKNITNSRSTISPRLKDFPNSSNTDQTDIYSLIQYDLPQKLDNYSNNNLLSRTNSSNSKYNSSGSEVSGMLGGIMWKGDNISNTEVSSPSRLRAENETRATFLESIPLTGDPEVDEEIIAFYKAKNKVAFSGR